MALTALDTERLNNALYYLGQGQKRAADLLDVVNFLEDFYNNAVLDDADEVLSGYVDTTTTQNVGGVKTFTSNMIPGLDVALIKEVAHSIYVADTTTSNTVGAALTVLAGKGQGSGNGAALTLAGGQGGATGTGGALSVLSGGAGATSGSSGAATFGSPAVTVVGNSGAVTLSTGNAGGGNSGNIVITTGTASATKGTISLQIGTTAVLGLNTAAATITGTLAVSSTLSSGALTVTGAITASTTIAAGTALSAGTTLAVLGTSTFGSTGQATITSTGVISTTLATDASSVSTGTIITSGGIGVAKAAWIGTTLNVAGAVTLQSTVTSLTHTITGALVASTYIETAGIIRNAAGSAAAPSYTFTGVVDLGAYKVSSTSVGFSSGGTLKGGWDSYGLFTSYLSEQVSGSGITVRHNMVKQNTLTATPATTTITAAVLLKGGISSTSLAAVVATLDTAANIATLIGAVEGTTLDFMVNNVGGANTVTIAPGAGILTAKQISDGDTAVACNLVVTNGTTTGLGLFRLVFTSAAAATLFRIH